MTDISYEYVCMCVWCIYFTSVYTHGLMPRVFFTLGHVAHAHVTHVYCLRCG